MTKPRIIPERPEPNRDDERKPYDRFSDLAKKIVRVPKSEIDKREKEWEQSHRR